MSHMLAVLKYLMGLGFCVLAVSFCPIYLIFEKLNFYIEKFVSIRRNIFRTHLNIYDRVFRKKING